MGMVGEIAMEIGRLGETVRIGVRTLTSIDTNPVPANWSHITKVDPEDEKKLPLLYPLYLRHTSAVSVGGSRDVNSKNTEDTFVLLERADVPLFHEPSAARHVTDRTREIAEFLAIPEVLNGDSGSLVGTLGEGTEYLRDKLVPETLADKVGWLPVGIRGRLANFMTSWMLKRAVFEAYIIQNVDSAAAREANVDEKDLLNSREAAQRALAAEKHLGSEVIYLEYSGTFGGDEAIKLLESVAESVSWSRIWYGGGLDSREMAKVVLEAGADAVIVGNVFHEIAEEEAVLCERAIEEIGTGASRDVIAEWVNEEIDIGKSSGTKYLSTIPSVPDPEAIAAEYLVATIQARLGLHDLSVEIGDAPSIRSVRQIVDGLDIDTLPGGLVLHRALDDSGERLAREYAIQYLVLEFDIEFDCLPIDHLGSFKPA